MELTQKQRSFLEAVHFAVLATLRADGMPHQTVMWYMLDGDRVLPNTPYDNRKHRYLHQDPRLSVCVEDAYAFLTLQGTVTMDEDPVRARADYARLGERYRGTLARRRPITDAGAATGQREHPQLLSRERVTLWLEVDRVIENKFGG